jgi:hypothetical protein
MSLAPTSAARVKMPVSPKPDWTQEVTTDTARNTTAKISAVVSCNGFAVGITKSSAKLG